MTGKIVKVPSLQEQVYRYVKNAIINNEFDLDAVYSEKWVAERLGVSRTPVREAILQLKQEYFVDILPYKGFKVKELSLEDVRDTFQIRQALEGFCVILIAQNYETDKVKNLFKRLDICMDEMKKNSDNNSPGDFVLQDSAFHREIIHYAGNERLISTYNDIRYRFERITLRVLTDYGRMATTIQEHSAVLEVMKTGKPWESFLAIQNHLDKTQKIMERKSAERQEPK